MWGGRTLPSMMGKELPLAVMNTVSEVWGKEEYPGKRDHWFSCCYEHYWLSVRQVESAENERHFWGGVFRVSHHGSMVGLGGELGKWFGCPILLVWISSGYWSLGMHAHMEVEVK
jgi:hypothetical protein